MTIDIQSPKAGADRRPQSAPERRVESVLAAIRILRHLSQQPAGAGVNAIARALELSPSSAFNLLKTLVAENFLDFDAGTKRYTLGPGVLALGRSALDPADAFNIARSHLESLADRRQITAALWRLTRSEQLVLVGFAAGEAATRIHLTVGHRLPMLAGATGRCVAAQRGANLQLLAKQLAAVKWAHAPSAKEYLDEVAVTRERGWAIDEGRYLHGVTTIAAPVFDSTGRLEFCVTGTMFSGQYLKSNLIAIGEDVLRAARWLAERLRGHMPAN
jgi:DNA-binding IclR family transcriptional regulator